MNPYLACVQASAKSWAAYHRWLGPDGIKGFEMHRAKADIEMYAAIYKVHRRRCSDSPRISGD